MEACLTVDVVLLQPPLKLYSLQTENKKGNEKCIINSMVMVMQLFEIMKLLIKLLKLWN